MKNRSFVAAKLSFLLLLIATSYCTAQTTASGQASTVQSVSQSNKVAAATLIPTIALHELTLSDTAINEQKGLNVVLNYYLDVNAVTLYGWTLNRSIPIFRAKGKFFVSKQIILKPIGNATDVTIGPKTFLGNQIILRSDVNKIIKVIKNDPEHRLAILHFIPSKKPSTKDPDSVEIIYTIKIEFIGRGVKHFADELFSTNPSPPHQNFD